MKKLLKEPLLHFVLIGFGLFVLYGWVSDGNDSQDKIYFDDYDMNNLIASWEMQWKRLPTDEELKSLVLQNIRQEVFYQEALKMNLDHNDEIIKRRLAQKMNFLSNDLAKLKEPSDQDLMSYYDQNKEKYMLSPVYSLYQVSFRSDSRENAHEDAVIFLDGIGNDDPELLENKGDRLPLPFSFESVNSDDLSRQLGMEFAQALHDLDTGKWTGPVRSGFGWHLVYITEKLPARAPEFESIRKELLRDLEYENQRNVNDQIYSELKSNYEVEFDLDPEKFDASFIEYLKSDEDPSIR
jgi:hypothetical protein